tara:strand:- start:8203 stop:9534 length:1332 start_codon:yes stop_codon:yes gene_type:complete
LVENKANPSNEQAEEAVIGAILIDETIYDKVVPWIRDDSAFYFEDTKKTWQCFRKLREEREPIDMITVINKAKDMFPEDSLSYYISGLATSTPTTSNYETYAKIVWERYIQREAIKTSHILNTKGFEKYKDTEETIGNHIRLLEELRDLQPDKSETIDSIADRAVNEIKEGGNIVRFGMFALDKPAGGMTKKEITVLGGRPGHGKTTLMLNVLKSLIQNNYKVLLFNREMSNTEMMRKLIVLESGGLTYTDMRKNNLEKFYDEIEESESKIRKKYKNLIMYDNVRTLEESMSQITKHKPDVVIDDYIQLIQHNPDTDRRFQIESIMQDYKWICKKENCAAFILSQLNREIERRIDPYPRMSDYAESGVIEQTVETALFVFYGYNFDHQEYDKYETEIISCKSRYGTVGGYKIGFNGNRCKFYNTKTEAMNDEKKSEGIEELLS